MPQVFYTEEEFKEALDKANSNALKLARKLANVISREEFASGIGGTGCILDEGPDAPTYCYGCPSVNLCPHRSKRFPK